MVDIRPFNGIRFNNKKITDMNLVNTEPYDKIGPQAQEEYYQCSPYNIVRVILGKELPGDTDNNNKYSRAATYLRSWQQEGILKKEPEPAIYLYEQIYTWENSPKKSRKAFISMVKIEESPDVIRPHENTLAGPKVDRLNLLRATQTDTEQIFVLYSDTNNRIADNLSSIYSSPPLFTYEDDFDVIHRFWVLTDTRIISNLQNEMHGKDLFIADGHHRYETCINYKREQTTDHPDSSPDEAFNFTMMTFVSMEDPGLTILPTHRLIKNLEDFNPDQFLSALGKDFSITEYPADSSKELLSSLGSRKHSFGLVLNGKQHIYLIQLISDSTIDRYNAPLNKAKTLDVAVLHSIILGPLLGIDQKKLTEQTNVFYKRSTTGTIREVLSGNYQLGFILNPTSIDEVKLVAGAGEKMPQKSTDFFPKIASGLVLSDISFGTKI